MTPSDFKRLEPFLYRVGDKSVIILYLLSFLSPKEITTASFEKLKESRSGITFIDTTMDNYLFDYDPSANALFCYRSGRPYSPKDIEKILIRAFSGQGLTYRGIEAFQSLIRGRAGQ